MARTTAPELIQVGATVIAAIVFGAVVLGASVLVGTGSVHAHPISLSSTTVDIREDAVSATVEIMLEDLVLYHQVSANGDSRFAADQLRQAARDHCNFLAEYLSFRDEEGDLIPMDVEVTDHVSIDEAGIASEDLMSRSVVFEMKAGLSKPFQFLTITQTFGGVDAALPAVMDLMILQGGNLLDRPVQIEHGRPYTVKLDWDDPPTESAGGLAALRQRIQDRFRQQLGITSYGGLYSFLYVERTQVRHEILIPLLTYERWNEIPRRDQGVMTVQEQSDAVPGIIEFFSASSKMEVNGRNDSPSEVKVRFFGLDSSDFAIGAEPRSLNAAQARIGVTLTYRHNSPIKELVMNWDTFNEYAPFMKTVVLAHEERPHTHYFREDGDGLHWKWERKNKPLLIVGVPAGKVLRNGRISLDGDEGRQSFERLISNVYQSFDQLNDRAIYEALEASASKSLVADLYLQVKRALVMTEQGSELAAVKDLNVLELRPVGVQGRDSATYRCRWTMEGVVEHWGHVHTRENEYDAVVRLVVEGGQLKTAELKIDDVRQLRLQTSLRLTK